jgi:glycosyltransferase involved in cell wall biosynthesis
MAFSSKTEHLEDRDISRPLKVGYISTQSVPSRETEPVQVLATVDSLVGAGVDVELIVPGRYGNALKSRPEFDAEVQRTYGLRNRFRIRQLFIIQPNPLHLERPAHALAAVLGFGKRFDLIHTRNFTALSACVRLKIPVIFETYRLLHRDAPRLARKLARCARSPHMLGVIAHSHQCADSLAMAGVSRDKIHVIHNGHDLARQTPPTREAARAHLDLPLDRPIACYTGSLQTKKGVDILLDLAQATPEILHVLVGGRDHDLAAFIERVRARGLDNVRCPGWHPPAELDRFMQAADVLLIPMASSPLMTHGITVLPMKTFVYLAAGGAILAPSLPDICEVLTHGDNAYLVPPDNVPAAAAGLRALIADPSLRARLGARATETAQGLSWQARAERIIALYRATLAALKHR